MVAAPLGNPTHEKPGLGSLRRVVSEGTAHDAAEVEVTLGVDFAGHANPAIGCD